MHAFNYECGNLKGFQKNKNKKIKKKWKESSELSMCEVIQIKSRIMQMICQWPMH